MLLQESCAHMAMRLLSVCQQVYSINSHLPNWFHCEFSKVAKEANIYDLICLCDSQSGMLADSRERVGLINNIRDNTKGVKSPLTKGGCKCI